MDGNGAGTLDLVLQGVTLSPVFVLQDRAQWRLGELLPPPSNPASLPASLCFLLVGAEQRQEEMQGAPQGASLSHLCFDVAMVIAEQ